MADKRKCFVIGPIGEGGSSERRMADWLLNGIIRPVLEADELGFEVKRADEDADPGSITSAVINDLQEADLVVADLTNFNPNVFYELGIRHTLAKPAIHIIAQSVKLPFDNSDQRTIFVDISDFDDVGRAKKKLEASALATMQDGYRVSNPFTRAVGRLALKESDDPKDRAIADLEERLASVENRLNPESLRTLRTSDWSLADRTAFLSDDVRRNLVTKMISDDAAQLARTQTLLGQVTRPRENLFGKLVDEALANRPEDRSKPVSVKPITADDITKAVVRKKKPAPTKKGET